MIILILLSALQETPPAERIGKLIEQLDADAFDARESASLALVEIGEPALDALRKAAEETTSPEVQVRAVRAIAQIEAEIRRKNFPGGDPVAGFQAAIRIAKEKPEFESDEKVVFEFEILNVDPKPRAMTAIGFIEAQVPGSADSYSQAHGRIVIKQLSGTTLRSFASISLRGSEPDAAAVELAPGESVRLNVGTSGFVAEGSRSPRVLSPSKAKGTLPPGEYEVHVVYFAKSKGLLEGADADLKSNVLRFTVGE